MPTRPHISFTTVKPCAKPGHRSNIPGTIECPRCIVSILPSQIPHRILPLNFLYEFAIFNGSGISEVPSMARSLDGALAKSDMHLLGDTKGESRQGRCVSLGSFIFILCRIAHIFLLFRIFLIFHLYFVIHFQNLS